MKLCLCIIIQFSWKCFALPASYKCPVKTGAKQRGGESMKSRDNSRTLLRALVVLLLTSVMVVAAGAFSSHSTQAAGGPVKLSKTSLKLKQFQEKKLKLKNAGALGITWISTNTNICEVDPDGTVKAVGGGSCTVVANYDGSNYICTVKVTPLELNETVLTLVTRRKGVQLTLNNKKLKKGLKWESANPSIASVDDSGFVTPHDVGSTIVTVTCEKTSLTCTVQVLDVNPDSLRKYRSPKNSSNRGKVVLAGSGLLDHWGMGVYSAFGSTDVINNAISHSTLANWKSWVKKLITSYKPKAVVLCIGSDDIGAGGVVTAAQCTDTMKKIIKKIRKKSRKTKIFVCSLPYYPDKPDSWPTISEVNSIMRKYCKKKKALTYLNLNKVLVKNQTPVAAFFREGKYALTSDGYGAIKKRIVKKVKKAAR